MPNDTTEPDPSSTIEPAPAAEVPPRKRARVEPVADTASEAQESAEIEPIEEDPVTAPEEDAPQEADEAPAADEAGMQAGEPLPLTSETDEADEADGLPNAEPATLDPDGNPSVTETAPPIEPVIAAPTAWLVTVDANRYGADVPLIVNGRTTLLTPGKPVRIDAELLPPLEDSAVLFTKEPTT